MARGAAATTANNFDERGRPHRRNWQKGEKEGVERMNIMTDEAVLELTTE